MKINLSEQAAEYAQSKQSTLKWYPISVYNVVERAYCAGYTACAESSVPLELAKDMATAIDALIKFTQARDDYGEAAKALGRQALDKAKSYLP